ncbi:MAG: S8 family serine peptidase [Vicinamibacterales bacterium]|jgi:subtilisin family serine protease
MSMDPAAWSLAESGSPDDEVGVILRLVPGGQPPPGVRIVSRFGDIVTARLRRGDIVDVRAHPSVFSLKAGDAVTMPPPVENPDEDAISEDAEAARPAAPALPADCGDGRGVVVGICDWGFDFTHANFRNPDGTTRLQCLWDQRGQGDPLAPAPYNQGRLLTREAINAALREPDPFAALGYHPASGDPSNSGAHGTHVADILAGNRREPGSEVGLASGADLVFVHLAAQNLGELGNLGDSIGLLEGLDFVRQQAAGRPCVLHLSAGKTGGPHRGNTLLERAVDAMLQQPGIVLVQSVGNYGDAAMHTHARVGPDQQHVLNWITPANDRTPNELEIWYSGEDVFDVTLVAPTGLEFSLALDHRMPVGAAGQVWGNFYHRLREPNSGLNHIVVFLYPIAPSGRWQIVLRGKEVVDGRLHAWIERDASGRYQSRFPREQASSLYTTNTICNCFRAIAVGAYVSTPKRPPTRFTSRGPTADGRQKPEIAAPGFRVRAARSTPRAGWQDEPRLCVKSGTSMAAPWVSGTVALMFAAAARPLTIHEVRRALIGSADPHAGPSGRSSTRLGYGYLNTAGAVALARRIGQETSPNPPPRPPAATAPLAAPPAFEGNPPIEVEDAAQGNVEVESWFESGDLTGSLQASESIDEDAGDEDADEDAGDEVAGEIESPIVWEDVRDAFDALDAED